ncbi:MAG: phosphoribosylformylglycinamidine synthase subunit PurL [Candidatus Bathyarchaeota archaeon]|nr:MAG: phosphoribosylformylglycinamidine synthase subunit PurL [Candidatus Bathyarchaeota archaeon]
MNLFNHQITPFEIYEIRVQDAENKKLLKISRKLGIGLNLEEMKAIKEYFQKKGRNPTDIELQTIGQTWSEHCFHRTFKGSIITESGEIHSLFKTYIAKATKELNPSWCISTFEDNAGIIEFNNNYAIAAKVETHNHPSAIEPFGGAATGVGGAIRDILGVWADPIVCTDVLGFGPLNYDYDKLPQGIKHPKYLFKGVVSGIGCYGNNMGIPTVNGAIIFDESYVGNVVVYCGCIGLLPKDKFVRNAKPGDIILLAGGRTGRDGIHGVTFASAELTEESEEVSRPAVQIANPIEEEKLKRAIIEVRDRKLGSGITDLGGGGLSSAIGEMAHRFSCGAHVDLEKVPLKRKGLAPWEIYVSESQERMLLLIPEKNLEQVLDVFREEDVEATPIGKLIEDKLLKIHYQNYQVAELDTSFLFNPPRIERSAKWSREISKDHSFPEPRNLSSYLLKLVSSLNIASREKVVRTYDHEVKGNTVLKPLHGESGGPNDAAVLKPLVNSWKGLVISCGINPRYGKIDPYWMAASVIDEAIRNNTAVGGRRIALLDNFVWGSPAKPDRLESLVKACKACYDFAKRFDTPFISGKDSLYNESPLGPVTPTLLVTAIGLIPDVRKAVSLDLKLPGNLIYAVGPTFAELGGSEYYRLKGFVGSSVPKVRIPQAELTMSAMVKAIDCGYLRASHDISDGGLAVAAAEMAFTSNLGMELHLKNVPRAKDVNRNDFLLFSESNSRFLVEVPRHHATEFESLTKDAPCTAIGKVTKEQRLRVYGLKDESVLDMDLGELFFAWKHGLEIEI